MQYKITKPWKRMKGSHGIYKVTFTSSDYHYWLKCWADEVYFSNRVWSFRDSSSQLGAPHAWGSGNMTIRLRPTILARVTGPMRKNSELGVLKWTENEKVKEALIIARGWHPAAVLFF